MRNLVNKINYFDDKAIFEPINDSNSGAILKKVIDNDKTYFLKIVSKDSIDINKIKKTLKIYKKNNIDTVELLNYGCIEKKAYLIYNFIDGYALNTVYDKYGLTDYYDMGFNIGYKYRLINSTYKFDSIFSKNYSVNDLANDFITSFKKLYYGKLNYIREIIEEEKMKDIIRRMQELTVSFNNEKKVYIHADMHPKNIMVDNSNKLYIVDIEAFCIDYFVMNIRWSIASAFKNKKNNQFFNGFINGYYNNKVPKEFCKQMIFVLILNFIEHIIEFSNTKDKDFILNYTSKINMIFNSIDLFSNKNILSSTTIFINN